MGLLQQLDAARDVLGVHALADGHDGRGDARLLAARRPRQGLANVLDVAMGQLVPKPLEELDRVLPGDERVACVEIQSEVGRIEEAEDSFHRVRVGRVGSMRLDVDDNLVPLGPFQHDPVVLLHEGHDLLVGVSGGLARAIGGVHAGAADGFGELDRASGVADAAVLPFGRGHRIRRIELRHLQPSESRYRFNCRGSECSGMCGLYPRAWMK